MTTVKSIIDDIGIKAFENSVNIASLAVISDSGELVYQTTNMDLIHLSSYLKLKAIFFFNFSKKIINLNFSHFQIKIFFPFSIISKNKCFKFLIISIHISLGNKKPSDRLL